MGCWKEGENDLFSVPVIAQTKDHKFQQERRCFYGKSSPALEEFTWGGHWISIVGGLQEQLGNILWQ